ncbi:MAG: response regulator [Thermodesulfovibrionales bacterium]|nr:response regulator [Thermodesulfovibrionales bacterium]
MQKDINILVVDDEPVVINSCERVLKEKGYNVHSAMRGKDAMLMMKDNIYNLVLTDLKMPEMDGISLIEWIRQSRPDTGIVVITGYPSHQTIQESLNLGCIDYVSKPFTPVMLTDATSRALKRIKKRFPNKEFSPATDIITGYSYIKGGDITNAGSASKALRSHLMGLGIPMEAIRRAAVSAFEAEMNVVMHAVAGILFYILKNTELKLIVRDIGPGMEDVELAMKEGYTTAPHWSKQMGWGTGLGLPNIIKNSDGFKIDSIVDGGTTLEIIISITGIKSNENN